MKYYYVEQQQQIIQQYGRDRGYYDPGPAFCAFEIRLSMAQATAGYDPPHLDALLQAAVVIDALQGQPLAPRPGPYDIPLPLAVAWKDPVHTNRRLYDSTGA